MLEEYKVKYSTGHKGKPKEDARNTHFTYPY